VKAQQFVNEKESRLLPNSTLIERFSILRNLAPAALAAGDSKKAEKYALELQALGREIKETSSYDTRIPSSATHVSNIVLGLIALQEGNITKAKEYLLAAAQFSGGADPSLVTFGPNMLLAKKLIERGERETVIQYLERCAKFWEMEKGRLENWKNIVKNGGMPDFGASVLYVVNTWRFA
jgi:hypothetical protein